MVEAAVAVGKPVCRSPKVRRGNGFAVFLGTGSFPVVVTTGAPALLRRHPRPQLLSRHTAAMLAGSRSPRRHAACSSAIALAREPARWAEATRPYAPSSDQLRRLGIGVPTIVAPMERASQPAWGEPSQREEKTIERLPARASASTGRVLRTVVDHVRVPPAEVPEVLVPAGSEDVDGRIALVTRASR